MNWLQRLTEHLLHTPKKVRGVWCVDGTTGIDTNVGHRPDDAFLTVGAAVNAAAAGDLIKVSEDTYDEAISVPAGLPGLEIICEPGTILVNTGAATVVSIAAPYARLEGCRIAQAGQIGLAVAGAFFKGKNIIADGCTVGFDMDGASPRMDRCISKNHTVSGWDISESDGEYIECFSVGTAAVTGWDFSHTNAELNFLLNCHSLNNTANGFNLVAGADNNCLVNCSQSALCGGPADAGANNSWINWSIESLIVAGQSVQEDLADIEGLVDDLETSQGRMLCTMDFWSLPQEEVALTIAAGDKALPSVTVADLPAGATIVRAIAMFKFRMVESHTYAGVNSLDGAQEIQVAASVDAINFVDTQFTLAQDTREGGDVVIGIIDIAATVNANGAYAFHWDLAKALQTGIKFNDIQMGIRIWYSV